MADKSKQDGREYFFMGSKVGILMDGQETEGRLALVQHLEKRGGEPPFHIHYNEDELLQIQEGELTFFLGDKQFDAAAGDFVFLPKGIPHRFEVKTEEVKFLVTAVPAGYESFVQEVGRPVLSDSDQPTIPTKDDIARLIKVGKKYNMSFLIDGEWK
ncbi:hypothetical protein AXI58_00740 [Bacillus nakamurai]|uniref:Cupin type-2 domain-containing protein n=1 Tax=Bacillus nakamurai TaxID=1793963 RepID=A0A150F7R0_9BACI|nr:cupin domain-containing protein [Bacillus nakamurai]KXZ20530.1 hypothetical protein AXI58_00740 [Bacillus nakamurai]